MSYTDESQGKIQMSRDIHKNYKKIKKSAKNTKNLSVQKYQDEKN